MVGTFETGVGGEAARALARVHAERSRSVRTDRHKQQGCVARHCPRINARNGAGKWRVLAFAAFRLPAAAISRTNPRAWPISMHRRGITPMARFTGLRGP